MIHNKTARELMYNWHGGQWSALYAAASSGLVSSFTDLAGEVLTIEEPDRARLMAWIQQRAVKAPEVIAAGRAYRVLPWVSRTY